MKLPEDETPLETTSKRLEKERNGVLAILQYISHYLGQYLKDSSTTRLEYQKKSEMEFWD